MTALTLRQLRSIAIISDVRMRDIKSFNDWLTGIVVTAIVIGGAMLASAIEGMM